MFLTAVPPSPSLRLSSSATLSWDSVGDDVTYTVTVTFTANGSSILPPINVSTNLSYTITDQLIAETDYTVAVTANNECGAESPPSEIRIVRVATSTPTPGIYRLVVYIM